ncbi:hypothetical protein LRS73_32765 (plasmid) [Methylobacterium currus]|uniref:hypothetical protein n=1 Tax=Methylobacterium currus TaxID=2051553 RepID=UPI001E4D2AB4|nr:hypothetical protein [Methylobacterium currus]UHC20131.1 hypothetical protein LRS73_32765 [Methylobacterium currus]
MRAASRATAPEVFLSAIATNDLACDGSMLSLPFNISAMVMWISLDRFARAGLDPDRLAVDAITRRPPTRHRAGLRLGDMLRIRALWAEAIGAALAGTKTPQHALDDAVARGNAALRLFQRRTAR